MAREIRITIDDEGRLDVWEGDRHTEQLAWDEMLGTIARLTMKPEMCGTGYPMLTDDEWRRRHPSLHSDHAEPESKPDFSEVEPAPVKPRSQCAVSKLCDAPNGHDGPCNDHHLPF